MKKSVLKGGFTYGIELLNREGLVIAREVTHNLWPTEGVNHMLAAEYKGGPQITTWYIGLFEGNYTPTIADVASTFPALATECTTYVEATRVPWVPGAVAAGTLNNLASLGEFTSNTTKTLYGAFLSGAAAKGSTSSVLGSIVRFSSPKPFESGFVLRVSGGQTLVSA